MAKLSFFTNALPLLLVLLPFQGGGIATLAAPLERRVGLPSGYARILFQDDFANQPAGSLPASSKWAIDTGTGYPGGPAHWGTGEVQSYTSSSANLGITSRGTLQITPVRASNGQWTSARIETTAANDFSCAAGRRLRMEASLLISGSAGSQAGVWPAFWSLGSSFRGNYNNWPSVGEIDILESINGDATVWQTVHCGSGSGGPCHETNGISSTAGFARGVWHTVAVEIDRTNSGGDWRGEKLTWFVDGSPTTSVTGAVVGDQSAWTSLARSSRYLLLNVAVGGSFPDAVANTKTPTAQTTGGSVAAMEVKYVAVYST
jgi:beta-glucanase (GH16 family)